MQLYVKRNNVLFGWSWLIFSLFVGSPGFVFGQETIDFPISIDQQEDRLRVMVRDGDADQLFTEYRFTGFAKPILYPVYGQPDVSLTRHFPMSDKYPEEERDHLHHKSIWFAHGEVNGVDFWTEKADIVHREFVRVDSAGFEVRNAWVDDEKTICTDRTHVQFAAGKSDGQKWRSIDYHVILSASEGELVLGDSKEGTFAIRTHPALRLEDQQKQAVGSAVNSQGQTGKGIWGQTAKWVKYQGDIDGQTWTIAMMDHPDNLRYPGTWHAREYGLIAANPFGLSYFQGVDKHAGAHTINEGDSLEFRYRLLFYAGELNVAGMETRFAEFAGQD